MKAAAAMTRDVVCIEPSDSLVEAFQIMTEWEIRHLPVLEGERLVGILSDRDVLVYARRTATGLEIEPMTVEDAMTPNPMTCGPNADIGTIGMAMTEHKIDSIPVVDDDGALVGLVTSTDLLELLVAKEEVGARRPIPFRFQVFTSARPGAAASRTGGRC